MAIEAHPAHSQQGAIVDFEPNGDSCVARFLTRDSNARIRVAQLIQRCANREGNTMKRRWIGWFSEAGREFLVFQHFFDLFLREEPGTRILHFGKKWPLLKLKNESGVSLVLKYLERGCRWWRLFHPDRFEPTEPHEPANIFFDFHEVESIARM